MHQADPLAQPTSSGSLGHARGEGELGRVFKAFRASAILCVDLHPSPPVTGGQVGLTGIALAHGLTIMAMAFSLGHLSGGHFNPAVTAAMFVTQRIDFVRAVGYILAQLLGATLAGFFLLKSLHNFDLVQNAPFLGACDLNGIGFKGGVAIEALITFLLVTVILRTPWPVVDKPEVDFTVKTIGELLMTDYVLPFGVVGVLLLAALVGASMLSSRDDEADEGEV